MSKILDVTSIKQWVLPYLSIGRRGFKSKIPLIQVVLAIFYRLKTGCQWRELPLKEFSLEVKMSWQSVYYYFNKWSKDGSWQQVWIHLLQANRSFLDLSSIQLDGSHTPAKRGGEAVGYQGRKSAKTSNSLFLSDNQGQMLAMSTPQSGEHNDLYKITELMQEMITLLANSNIETNGLFLNADAGFDAENLRVFCHQKKIEPNIKSNPRNKKKDQKNTNILMKNCIKNEPSSNTQMLG
jgi:transposase